MKITIVGRKLNVYDDTRELIEKKLAKERSEEIFSTTPKENMCWCKYDDKKCNKK